MTPQRYQQLTTDRPVTAKLVKCVRRRLVLCQHMGREWFQWGDVKLPRRLNPLWRWLARF
jgi:hypothetical protein